MTSGRPENPVNAVAPDAVAHCQIRYTVDSDPATFVPALRRHLDAAGFPEIAIEGELVRMAASRTDPANPGSASPPPASNAPLAATSSSFQQRRRPARRRVRGLPRRPLIWIPHSYNGCKQHGPNEHLLKSAAREGLLAMTGLWYDLGEAPPPTP